MSQRIIQIVTEDRLANQLEEMVQNLEVVDLWESKDGNKHRISYSLLVPLNRSQAILDVLNTTFGHEESTRILLLPVSASLPIVEEPSSEKKEKHVLDDSSALSREELYDTVVGGTQLDKTFIFLILLSTVVASIGLLENNIAVMIASMVIAPMLGPNLAFALATTLGDVELMKRAVKTNLTGILACLVLAFVIGWIWPYGFHSTELLMRTDVDYDGIVLALASGAAAVLSLSSGLSSVLVGVMVAVALLLPITAMGLTLGAGSYKLAAGAGLLFAVNIVCVNLSANIVFVLKGIRPRRWFEKQKARRSVLWQLFFWGVLLLIVALAIYVRHGLRFME